MTLPSKHDHSFLTFYDPLRSEIRERYSKDRIHQIYCKVYMKRFKKKIPHLATLHAKFTQNIKHREYS